uniref:Uncharacterized protein n=1 Tax=Quercus lobata TaxID=97700 RepID=A0A7N2N1K6_QUELO
MALVVATAWERWFNGIGVGEMVVVGESGDSQGPQQKSMTRDFETVAGCHERGARELIKVEFVVEFLLDHLREIARAFFTRNVQLAVDAIDARIKSLKKEAADLKACHERLLSRVTDPSHFGDQTLISDL